MPNKRLLSLAGAAVLVGAACLKYALFGNGDLRPISLDPQRAVEKLSAGAEPVYADQRFQLYLIPTGDGVSPQAYAKRLGVWVRDYPDGLSISPACTVDGTVYYFGLPDSLRGASLAVLESPEGERIDGLPLTVAGETRFLFRLPAQKSGAYRFAPVVDGSPLPAQTDPFTAGSVLVEGERDGEHLLSREIPLSELSSYPELEGLLREAYASADRTKPVEDGRTYPGTLQMDSLSVYLTANLGDYLKLEEKKLPFTFTHSVSLHLELEGYHPATISFKGTDLRTQTLEEYLDTPLEVYPFPLSPALAEAARDILAQYPAPQEE